MPKIDLSMPKIGIIYNDIKPIACKTAHQIQDQLLSRGWQVFMATGSGGLLARQLATLNLPLLTVNTGHMGFLTEIYLNQLEPALELVLEGNYTIENRSMITVRLFREDTLLWEALSLNEVVVHREPLTSMCHFEIQ